MQETKANFSIVKESELGSNIICLLKIDTRYFVRISTGKEGIVNEIYGGDSLEEAEKVFNDRIK
jgi:hypothetical protein